MPKGQLSPTRGNRNPPGIPWNAGGLSHQMARMVNGTLLVDDRGKVGELTGTSYCI